MRRGGGNELGPSPWCWPQWSPDEEVRERPVRPIPRPRRDWCSILQTRLAIGLVERQVGTSVRCQVIPRVRLVTYTDLTTDQ
jgi:hypothetical protein